MSGPEEMLRLFVAIPTPAAIKAAIEKFQQQLRSGLAASVIRWTPVTQFHLTLRFLGAVRKADVDRMSAPLTGACKAFAPLHLEISGAGSFPANKAPRVLWLGVCDSESRLGELQKAMAARCDPFSSEEPERTFSAHITLGRVKEMRPREAAHCRELLGKYKGERFGDWTAGEVELIQSELSSEGARHNRLVAFPLSCA
jgi:2'-5' RNA ligase